MSRITQLEINQLTERQRAVYDMIVAPPRDRALGPLAVWLHRPELARRAQSLGRYCRYDTLLPPKLSELAILVTARVWNSEFEWQAHKKCALAAGLSISVIESVRQGIVPEFESKEEAVVHDFSFAVQRERKVPQVLYDLAVSVLGEAAVVDLTGLLGYYGMISMTINVFEVDPLDATACELD